MQRLGLEGRMFDLFLLGGRIPFGCEAPAQNKDLRTPHILREGSGLS
jgi:hypothetical protein